MRKTIKVLSVAAMATAAAMIALPSAQATSLEAAVDHHEGDCKAKKCKGCKGCKGKKKGKCKGKKMGKCKGMKCKGCKGCKGKKKKCKGNR